MTEVSNAIQIALGNEAVHGFDVPLRIRGAENYYNARGHGSTMARRVLRDGTWQWVSDPASPGRMRASDRKDVKYGDVWIGEIVAEYVLFQRKSTPCGFWLVTGGKPTMLSLKFSKRRDGQFSLTLPDVEEPLVVSDPNWRTK